MEIVRFIILMLFVNNLIQHRIGKTQIDLG